MMKAATNCERWANKWEPHPCLYAARWESMVCQAVTVCANWIPSSFFFSFAFDSIRPIISVTETEPDGHWKSLPTLYVEPIIKRNTGVLLNDLRISRNFGLLHFIFISLALITTTEIVWCNSQETVTYEFRIQLFTIMGAKGRKVPEVPGIREQCEFVDKSVDGVHLSLLFRTLVVFEEHKTRKSPSICVQQTAL